MATNKDNYINKTFEHDRDKFEKNITLNSRAFLIADAVAKGMTYRQIVAKYMAEWGVSYNYMHSIITESLNLFKSDELYKNIRDINNERLTAIYQEARAKFDLETAIKAVDKLNKANGVYDDHKATVSVQTDDSNITITFGGDTIEQAEAKFNNVTDVPYDGVDELVNALNEAE